MQVIIQNNFVAYVLECEKIYLRELSNIRKHFP